MPRDLQAQKSTQTLALVLTLVGLALGIVAWMFGFGTPEGALAGALSLLLCWKSLRLQRRTKRPTCTDAS